MPRSWLIQGVLSGACAATGYAFGVFIGWLVGLLLPGGPYVFFPIAAQLARAGVAPAALLTLVTAKTLVSPIRMLTYEAPVLGWPLTLARLVPGVLLPPIVGVVGAWLYRCFARSG